MLDNSIPCLLLGFYTIISPPCLSFASFRFWVFLLANVISHFLLVLFLLCPPSEADTYPPSEASNSLSSEDKIGPPSEVGSSLPSEPCVSFGVASSLVLLLIEDRFSVMTVLSSSKS